MVKEATSVSCYSYVHGAEIMVQRSRNDSEQITLLHGVNI